MIKTYDIKITNRNNPQQFVILATCYKSIDGAKARRDYEAWKYGKAYSVEIWETMRG